MSLSSNSCLSKEAGQKTTLVCLVTLLNVKEKLGARTHKGSKKRLTLI